MLIFEVIVDVPAGGHFRGGVVIFDMVGRQAGIPVPDYHVAIGYIQIALPALWPTGRELGKLAFGGRKFGLLRMRLTAGWKDNTYQNYSGNQEQAGCGGDPHMS